MTNERNCENCAHARPFGGENDNRCEVWECEYINRQEAIEAFKARRDETEWEWCHDCKEYDQEAHCCHRWTKVIRNCEIHDIPYENLEAEWFNISSK